MNKAQSWESEVLDHILCFALIYYMNLCWQVNFFEYQFPKQKATFLILVQHDKDNLNDAWWNFGRLSRKWMVSREDNSF